jgi:ATPase family associated with various cellular activities (AAA)
MRRGTNDSMPTQSLLRAPLGGDVHLELLLAFEDEGGAPPGVYVIQSVSAKVRKQSAVRLAKAMGRRTFQINLGAIASGYIGETEKSLAALLDRAEASAAVLFFDEADALFGTAKTRNVPLAAVVRDQLAQRAVAVIAGTLKVRTPGDYWKNHARIVLHDA